VRGFVDKYPVSALRRYETELYSFLDNSRPDVLKLVREGKAFDDDEKDASGKKTGRKIDTPVGAAVKGALEEFARQFDASGTAAA
jgi:hypothetical protein